MIKKLILKLSLATLPAILLAPSPLLAQTAPTPAMSAPTPATSAPPIASLPDGVYRFWNGRPTSAITSDAELLRQGGMLFLFRKTGSQIAGTFSYIDNEAICVTGQVTGNTIAGQAIPFDRTINNMGESFSNWGPTNTLRVRRGRRAGSQSRYDSALLNLNGFSRINIGNRLPPTCR